MTVVEKPVDTVNICKRRRPLRSLKWTRKGATISCTAYSPTAQQFLPHRERAFRMCTWRAVRCRKQRMLWRTSGPRPPDRRKDQPRMYKDKCQGKIGTNLCVNLMNKLMKKLFIFSLCASFLFAIFCPLCWLQQVLPLELNLASLTSVRNFVAEWKSSIRRVLKLEVTKLWTKSSQETCGYLGVQCRSSFRHPNLGLGCCRCNFIDTLVAHSWVTHNLEEWHWWFLPVSSRSRPNRSAIHRRRSGRPKGNVYKEGRGGCRNASLLRFWTHGWHKSFGSLLTGEFAAWTQESRLSRLWKCLDRFENVWKSTWIGWKSSWLQRPAWSSPPPRCTTLPLEIPANKRRWVRGSQCLRSKDIYFGYSRMLFIHILYTNKLNVKYYNIMYIYIIFLCNVNVGSWGDLSGLGKGMVDGAPFDAGMLGCSFFDHLVPIHSDVCANVSAQEGLQRQDGGKSVSKCHEITWNDRNREIIMKKYEIIMKWSLESSCSARHACHVSICSDMNARTEFLKSDSKLCNVLFTLESGKPRKLKSTKRKTWIFSRFSLFVFHVRHDHSWSISWIYSWNIRCLAVLASFFTSALVSWGSPDACASASAEFWKPKCIS